MKCSYKIITGEETFFTKQIVECVEKVKILETALTRGQNKKPRYLTEVLYMVTKTILMYTESCRDALEGGPFAVRHMDFDSI